MPTRHVRDMCGLSCVAEFAEYADAELFVYSIGTGVLRSLFELIAHDRKTHALLFDLQVEASSPALEGRALAAGTYPDAQAVALALSYARRIIDTKACDKGTRFRLLVDAAGESLRQIAAP